MSRITANAAIIVLLLGCGSKSDPRPSAVVAPAPADTAATTAPIDAGLPDAAPIRSIDVVRAAARTDTTLYVRPAPGMPCQPWRLRAAENGDTRGRLVHQGDPALSFEYRIDGDLELVGPYRGATGEPIAGPLQGDACRDRFSATADDRDAIHLGGGAWYFDAQACEAGVALAPRGCTAAVAVAIGRVDRSRNLFDYLVKKRGPVTRLARADDGMRCERWRFGRDRLSRTEREQDAMYYETGYDGAALTLSGPMYEDEDGSIGIGSFGTYPVDIISDEVALVGGMPWFIREQACEQAAAATRP